MNPPYNTKNDIHVEIVKNCLNYSDNVVSIMPNDFLKTNKYNKKHERYRNTKINYMLDCNDELSIQETNDTFGIDYTSNTAILVWNNNSSYDYDTVYKETNKKDLIEKQKLIQKIVLEDETFKTHKFISLTKYNGNGFFIPIGTHGANIATEFGMIENDEICYDYKGRTKKFDKAKFYSLETNNSGKGIYVKNKEEGLRLLNLFRSKEYMDFQKLMKCSCETNFRHDLKFCPILDENEKLISDEAFFIIHNI